MASPISTSASRNLLYPITPKKAFISTLIAYCLRSNCLIRDFVTSVVLPRVRFSSIPLASASLFSFLYTLRLTLSFFRILGITPTGLEANLMPFAATKSPLRSLVSGDMLRAIIMEGYIPAKSSTTTFSCNPGVDL